MDDVAELFKTGENELTKLTCDWNEEPKQYEIRDINSVMNSYAAGWRRFSNPRYFPEPYGKQQDWERMPAVENTADTGDGLRELSEAEAKETETAEGTATARA